jgi:hypothetical protein
MTALGEETPSVKKVRSADRTLIVYERFGAGPLSAEDRFVVRPTSWEWGGLLVECARSLASSGLSLTLYRWWGQRTCVEECSHRDDLAVE